MNPETLMVIDPDPTRPRNSEGAFLVIDDRRVAFAYTRFTGGSHDSSSASIVVRASDDAGESWSEDRELVANEGKDNVMSVSILPLSADDTLFFYMRKDGWGDCRLHVRRSPDGLETLSDPVPCIDEPGYNVINNDRAIRHSSGRLVVPAALHPCPDGTRETWSRCGHPRCFLSDDNGATWRRSRAVVDPPAEAGDAGLQEPGLVELKDGRIWMFARTDSGHQWQSFSADAGETWDAPGPSLFASPCSPLSVKRIPATGDLFAVWNDHSGSHPFAEGKRTPLCVSVSRDDGASWSPSRVLESDPEGWYCYTAIAFQGDRVLLGYCGGNRNTGGLNRLKLTAIPLDWVYEDTEG